MINIDLIRIDGGTQCRTVLDQQKIAEYAQSMKDGDEFPEIETTFDGGPQLAVRRIVWPRILRRRHQSAAQLPHHLFPGVSMRPGIRQLEALEHDPDDLVGGGKQRAADLAGTHVGGEDRHAAAQAAFGLLNSTPRAGHGIPDVRLRELLGVIVQFGGQTPLKLARDLEANGVPIIGTTPDSIDIAEDRERFQKLLHKLKLKQPPNRTVRSAAKAIAAAEEIGYPLVVRPSYVLGGRAMEIVHQQADLERYMREAVKVSNDSPVLLDRFLNDAIEVDVDAVSDGKEVIIGGVMEHIEQAGVHSGDSACSLPPFSLSAELQAELRRQTVAMEKALKVCGLMNVQFAIQKQNGEDVVYVLEVNPRASRTMPFVSKATGLPLAKIAARCQSGKSLQKQLVTKEVVPPYFSVKEAVFPFIKFRGEIGRAHV